MPSQFGGIPVDAPPAAGSKFGGSPVASGGSTAPAKPEQSFGATVREYAHKMNPLAMFQGLANATSSPEGTGAAVNAYGQQNEKMLHDASDAYQNGDYTGAARHFFHYLINGFPGLGSSLEEAGNKFQQHDFAGGLADTAALATQLYAGAKAPEIAGTLRDAGAEAVDSVRPTPKPAEAPSTPPSAAPATTAGRLQRAATKFGLKQIKKASGLDTVSDAYDALKDAGVIGGDQAATPASAAPPAPAPPATGPAAVPAAPKPSPLRPPLAEGTPPAPAPPDIPTPNAGGGGPLRAPVRGQVPAPPPPPNLDDAAFLNDYNRAVKMPPPPPGPEIPPDQPLLKEGAPPPPPPADSGATTNLPPEPPSPAQQAEGPAPTATPPAPPANMSKADWTQYQADLKAAGFKTDPGAYPGAKPGSRIGQSFARSARGQVAPKSVRTFPSEQLEPFATNEGMSVENAYDALKSNGWLVKYPAATQPVQ